MTADISVPVFHATHEDVAESFGEFVESCDARIAGPGICKIIPPPGWTPRKAGYGGRLDFTIPQPIRQLATGGRGFWRLLLVQQKPQSLDDFLPVATAEANNPPADASPADIERRYWRSLTLSPPLYGADVEGSLFDEDLTGWNLRNLDSLLSRTLEAKKVAMPGVNTPYLYFGMWRATFAWHTEDVDLHSVNYLHYGAPKSWYCIPPAHRKRFELLAKGILPDLFRECPEFMRHKEILISPELLRQHNIPVVKVVQYPGEFVINYPGAYHSGFNHGYNCAESTNFATSSWLPIGACARPCDCREDTVKIQMSLFLDAASPKHRQAILDAMSSDDESSEEDEDEASCSDSDSQASGSGAGSSSSHYEARRGAARKKPSKPHPPAVEADGKARAAAAVLAKESRNKRHAAREEAAKAREHTATRSQPAAARLKPEGAKGPTTPARLHRRIEAELVGPASPAPRSKEPWPQATGLLPSSSGSQDSQQDTTAALHTQPSVLQAGSPSQGKAGKQQQQPAPRKQPPGPPKPALQPARGGKRPGTRSADMQLRSGAVKKPRLGQGLVQGLAKGGELLSKAVTSLTQKA